MCRLGMTFAVLVASLATAASLRAQQPGAPPAEKVDESRIATLVKELGDSSFAIREAAQKELMKIGEKAEAALGEAARSFDVEVSRRAKRVLAEFARLKQARLVDKVTWPVLLERVRQHGGTDDWKQPGFSDELIEGAIERLVERVNEIVGEQRLKLPVRFGECRVARGKESELRGEGLLFCGSGSFDLHGGTRSIILVDGSVRIGYATECLIIARGAVHVSHGQGNIILAGQFVDVAHDGSRLGIDGAHFEGRSSLILCGNILRISHAKRAVCSALLIDMTYAPDCIFLHERTKPISIPRGGVAVETRLPFAPSVKENPLEREFRVAQVVDTNVEKLARIERGGVEIAVHLGDAIRNHLGQPIPALAGWKLDFIGDNYALFSNGKEDAGFVVPRRREQ